MDVKDDTMKSKSNHTSNIPVPSYRGLRRSQEELEAKEEARKQRSSANAQSLAKSVLEQDLESKAAAATPPEKLRRGLGQSPPTQLQTKERTARERSAAASRVRPDPDGSRLPTTWDRENEEEDNGEDSDDVITEAVLQRQEVAFSSSPGTEIRTATTPPFAPVDASSSDEMVQYGEAVGLLAEEAVVQEPLFHTTEGSFQGTTREAANANTEAESSILPLPSPQAPSPPNESLVEARPVPEEEEHPPEGLMEAQPVDLEQKAAQRSEHRKQFRNRAFVGGACIILAVVVAIVLWLVLRQDNPPVQVVAPADNNTSAPTFSMAPSGSPTNAPTTTENLFVSNLPNISQTRIQDTLSPQSKALDWLSNHTDFQSMTDWRRRQLLALASFYYSFAGEQWPIISDNWLNDGVSECLWFSNFVDGSITSGPFFEQGFTFSPFTLDDSLLRDLLLTIDTGSNISSCNSDGMYTVLALRGFLNPTRQNVVSMPPEVGFLTRLQAVILDNNDINASFSNIFPLELAQLPNLTVLVMEGDDIIRNQFIHGTIPTYIGLASSLDWLEISNNLLEGPIPSEIGLLTGLAFLDLDGNAALNSTLPSEVGTLTNLVSLDLGYTDLSGVMPTEIYQLTDLSYLRIPLGVSIPPSYTTNWPRLDDFAIQGGSPPNGSSSFPLSLLEQEALERIDLTGGNYSGRIPTMIGTLTKLRHLVLANNSFTGPIPSELARCSRLRTLNLTFNRLTGSIPTELRRLSGLSLLWLQNNLLSGTVPDWDYRRWLFTLVAHFNDNLLTGTIPASLGEFPRLWAQDLSWNALSGPLPTQLGMLSDLNRFDISNNGLITGRIPSELGLPNGHDAIPYTRFFLANNSLTGTIPAELQPLDDSLEGSLVVLDVAGNNLSGQVPQELCSLDEETCVWFSLDAEESCMLQFDCTERLCGCDCNCPVATDPPPPMVDMAGDSHNGTLGNASSNGNTSTPEDVSNDTTSSTTEEQPTVPPVNSTISIGGGGQNSNMSSDSQMVSTEQEEQQPLSIGVSSPGSLVVTGEQRQP